MISHVWFKAQGQTLAKLSKAKMWFTHNILSMRGQECASIWYTCLPCYLEPITDGSMGPWLTLSRRRQSFPFRHGGISWFWAWNIWPAFKIGFAEQVTHTHNCILHSTSIATPEHPLIFKIVIWLSYRLEVLQEGWDELIWIIRHFVCLFCLPVFRTC